MKNTKAHCTAQNGIYIVVLEGSRT